MSIKITAYLKFSCRIKIMRNYSISAAINLLVGVAVIAHIICGNVALNIKASAVFHNQLAASKITCNNYNAVFTHLKFTG